jgi:hypothetical protein
MKFWELTSAFRSETDNLKSVLKNDRWKKYHNYYENLNSIIAKQDRNILNEEVPFHLAKEVCELSKLKFYLYYKDNPHCLSSYKQDTDQPFEELSSVDILIRFGGSFIEETLEKSTSEVTPRKIGNDIEVLGVYKLTNIGMMAFLRIENSSLKKDDIIASADNTRQWKVIEEPFMFIDPYEAYEKRERQIEQGIRLYKILPVDGSGKPREMEILKLT